MNQIVLYTDKGVVLAHRSKLFSYITAAKQISEKSTYAAIRGAEAALNKAKSLFDVLDDFGYLGDCSITKHDIDTTEAKIQDVLDQKRMRDMIQRH